MRRSTVEVGPEDLLVRREDVHQETVGVPGAEDPTTVVLRQQRGLMRARRADTVEAALVGACDGDLTVGQILDALAQLLDGDPGELRSTYLPVVRELVEEGFLTRLIARDRVNRSRRSTVKRSARNNRVESAADRPQQT